MNIEELKSLLPYSDDTVEACLIHVCEKYNVSEEKCIKILIKHYATTKMPGTYLLMIEDDEGGYERRIAPTLKELAEFYEAWMDEHLCYVYSCFWGEKAIEIANKEDEDVISIDFDNISNNSIVFIDYDMYITDISYCNSCDIYYYKDPVVCSKCHRNVKQLEDY